MQVEAPMRKLYDAPSRLFERKNDALRYTGTVAMGQTFVLLCEHPLLPRKCNFDQTVPARTNDMSSVEYGVARPMAIGLAAEACPAVHASIIRKPTPVPVSYTHLTLPTKA